jgi:hypothetical protein
VGRLRSPPFALLLATNRLGWRIKAATLPSLLAPPPIHPVLRP